MTVRELREKLEDDFDDDMEVVVNGAVAKNVSEQFDARGKAYVEIE